AQTRFVARVPGQALERSTNGEEEPYQDWGAVEGRIADAPYTVALLNNSTYSYDCLGGLFRTVLIRSAPFARHNPGEVPHNDNNAWQDQGRQERRFWLLAGKGPYSSLNLDRRANEFQSPAEYVMNSRHTGTEPWERSFLEVLPGSEEVLSIKLGEAQNDAAIVRLQEKTGRRTEATVKSSVWEFTHSVQLEPWEIKTLRVELKGEKSAAVKELSLLEI